MLGKKINEFEATLGTLEDFNKIFPKTPIEHGENIEIMGIKDAESIFTQNLFVRNINVDGKIISHDFGRDNFADEVMGMGEKVRFKYFAFDLSGNLLAIAYNTKDLAVKLNCGVAVVKNRLNNTVDQNAQSSYLFNVKRVEL